MEGYKEETLVLGKLIARSTLPIQTATGIVLLDQQKLRGEMVLGIGTREETWER